MNQDITIARLGRLLDAYGAEASRWPGDERIAVQALLARSAEARALVAEARRLDHALAAVRPPRPGAAVAARLRGLVGGGAPSAPPAPAFAARPFGRPLAALALASSLLLGVSIGLLRGTDESLPPALGGALADWAAAAPDAETTVVIGLVEAEPWPYDTRVALTLY